MLFQRVKPRKKKFLIKKPNYDSCADIVQTKLTDYVVKTGEGECDFVVKKKIVEISRVNRLTEYKKRAKGHSIYEVIDRFIETGDASLLHKTDGAYFDVSKLPKNGQELNDRLLKACEIWDKLPSDLKGDMTLTDFVQSMNDEKILSYLKSVEKPVKTEVKKPVEIEVKTPQFIKKDGE